MVGVIAGRASVAGLQSGGRRCGEGGGAVAVLLRGCSCLHRMYRLALLAAATSLVTSYGQGPACGVIGWVIAPHVAQLPCCQMLLDVCITEALNSAGGACLHVSTTECVHRAGMMALRFVCCCEACVRGLFDPPTACLYRPDVRVPFQATGPVCCMCSALCWHRDGRAICCPIMDGILIGRPQWHSWVALYVLVLFRCC